MSSVSRDVDPRVAALVWTVNNRAGRTPTQAVAKKFGLTYGQAVKLVGRLRQAGLITTNYKPQLPDKR